MKCIHCGAELKRGTAPFHVDRSGYHVHWDAIPAWVCAQCGEMLFEKEQVDVIQSTLSMLDEKNRQVETVIQHSYGTP